MLETAEAVIIRFLEPMLFKERKLIQAFQRPWPKFDDAKHEYVSGSAWHSFDSPWQLGLAEFESSA